MLFIYERVVEKLKNDSILKYEERKHEYRVKNNIDQMEQPIRVKQSDPVPPKRQRTFQNYQTNQNQSKVQERPIKPQPQNVNLEQTYSESLKVHHSVPLVIDQTKSIHNPTPQPIKEEPIRPIKPLQTQSVVQNEHQQVQLVRCTQGCQRQFAASALQKHIKICKKVFQTKRNPIDIQEKRLNQLQKVAASKSSEVAPKKSNFKEESRYFQTLMRQQKGEQLTEQQQAQIKAYQDSKLDQCKNCKKRIAPDRMESHLKACLKIRK